MGIRTTQQEQVPHSVTDRNVCYYFCLRFSFTPIIISTSLPQICCCSKAKICFKAHCLIQGPLVSKMLYLLSYENNLIYLLSQIKLTIFYLLSNCLVKSKLIIYVDLTFYYLKSNII